MKWFALCSAVSMSVLLIGCRNDQEQSPKDDGAPKLPTPNVQAMQNGPGRIDHGPVSIAGDAVVGSSRTTPANSPSASAGPVGGRSGPAGGAMPPRMNGSFGTIKMHADEEVSGSYTVPNGMTISVEAVCKISEDTVTCWKPDGTRDKNLEAKLDKILQSNQSMYSQGISLKYKKKNRLILFKKLMPIQHGNAYSYASITQIGDDMNSSNYSYINVAGLAQPYNGQGPQIDYEMRSVAVPIDQSTVNVYIRSTKPEPLAGTLKFSKGSKLTSDKFSIEYVSQSPSTERFNGTDSKAWDLTFKIAKPDENTEFSFIPVVKEKGIGFGTVNKSGDLVKSDIPNMNRMGPARGPQTDMRPVMVSPVSLSSTEMKLRTNVNPKCLTGFSITVLRSHTIKLKNIKLY